MDIEYEEIQEEEIQEEEIQEEEIQEEEIQEEEIQEEEIQEEEIQEEEPDHLIAESTCAAICHTRQKCTKRTVLGKSYCKRHSNIIEVSDVFVHEVYEKNINGIVYYSDKEKWLFSISDIIQRVPDPAIVGRWYMDETNGVKIELFPTE